MRIMINYDLLDKIRDAKTGISLDRSFKRILFYTNISGVVGVMDNLIERIPPEEFIIEMLAYVCLHTMLTGVNASIFKEFFQNLAESTLNILAVELNKNCIKTDQENILKSYKTKTEYGLNFEESSQPKLEQRKYISIPVHDEWGDREMEIVQEHIIGTDQYILSLPSSKEKVLTLGRKTMKQI